MLQNHLFSTSHNDSLPCVADIVRTIADHSTRPRYTFMVLDLIVRVAGEDGHAGPWVRDGKALVPIREWLATAIAPSAARHHKRRSTAEKVRSLLTAQGKLPTDREQADRLVAEELRLRILETGMTAVSRAVSELVRAGLIRRHYQGYCVDHQNRGAQRQVVYTITDLVRSALHPAAASHGYRKHPLRSAEPPFAQ